jgi:hypothetical protein
VRRAGTEEHLRLKAVLMGLLRADWQKFGAVERATERIVAVWTTNPDGPPLPLKYVKLFAIQNTSYGLEHSLDERSLKKKIPQKRLPSCLSQEYILGI